MTPKVVDPPSAGTPAVHGGDAETSPVSVRVIGIGHPDRGDDAAGRTVARRLRAERLPGVDVREHDGEAASLMALWRGARTVIVVDAMRSGRPPGAHLRLDATREDLPVAGFAGTTHGFGLAEAVALARTLGALPESLVVHGIEAARFDPGAPLTPAVAAAVERLGDDLAAALAVDPTEPLAGVR